MKAKSILNEMDSISWLEAHRLLAFGILPTEKEKMKKELYYETLVRDLRCEVQK
jgi:hypothetical protein